MAPCPHVLRSGRCDRSGCTYDHQKTQCSCGITLDVQTYNAHIRGKKHKDLIKNKAPPPQPATANAGEWVSSGSLPQFDRFYVDLQHLHDAMFASWTSLVEWSTMRTVAAEHTETHLCVRPATTMPLSARPASPAHPRRPATFSATSAARTYTWTSGWVTLPATPATSSARRSMLRSRKQKRTRMGSQCPTRAASTTGSSIRRRHCTQTCTASPT